MSESLATPPRRQGRSASTDQAACPVISRSRCVPAWYARSRAGTRVVIRELEPDTEDPDPTLTPVCGFGVDAQAKSLRTN